MLVCFHVSLSRLVVNFLKGKFLPNWSNLFFLGDRFHSAAHSFLILVLNVLLILSQLEQYKYLNLFNKFIAVT